MLDPFTIFVITTAFMLGTGAVLGFIHSGLSEELKPAAADWRLGTLLLAGGALLLASRGIRAVDWVIPIANGCLLFGQTLYWRALRRFHGLPDRQLIFVPCAIAVLATAYFVFVVPSFNARVLIISCTAVVLGIGCIITLLKDIAHGRTVSANVLAMLFFVSVLFGIERMVHRGIELFTIGSPPEALLTATVPHALTPVVIALLPIIGTTAFVLLLFERIRKDLHRVATVDALTELPNRRTIGEFAAERFARAAASGQAFSIAVIDIDHFKQINDQFGHDAGDLALQSVARTLRGTLRGTERVGRQGGEEFVALFEEATERDALAAAERIRTQVEAARHHFAGEARRITVSVGVASLQDSDAAFGDLLRRADAALYAAKAAGRNCVRGATPFARAG